MKGREARAVRRRISLLVVMLLALAGMARAETLCLVTEGWARLTDEAGTALVEGVKDAFPVREGALYAAGEKGEYRLYDARGSLLGDAEFAMIDDAGDCLIYRVGRLYGALDMTGNPALPARWTQLVSDGAGGWLALNTDPLDEAPDNIYHIDIFGNAVDTGASTLNGLSRLCDDRMPILTADGRCGAVDGRGAWAVDPVWLTLSPFEGGVAKAADEDGLGLIDVNGASVIPPIYDWLERSEDCVAAKDSTGIDVYSADGRRLLFSVAEEDAEVALIDRYIAIYRDGKTRLYDLNGAVIYESERPVAFAPGVDGQLIASDGKWGEACVWLMDPDGSAASGRCQRLVPLLPGRYAYMTMEGIEYYSDTLDGVQTSWNYDSLRCGLMDGAGNELTPAEYLEIRAVGENRLLMISEAGVTLADGDGNVIKTWLTPQTEAATGEAGGGATG